MILPPRNPVPAPGERFLVQRRVESRTGTVAVVCRWLLTGLSPRRLSLVWPGSVSCSRSSNPDWRISRIRLSEKNHAFAHARLAVRCGNCSKPYTECSHVFGSQLSDCGQTMRV